MIIYSHYEKSLKEGNKRIILKVENEQQMIHFFAEHTNAKEIKIEENWGIAQQYGRQLFPEHDRGDGFYYCRIEKTA